MCGIAGILNSGLDHDDLEVRLQRFARDLRHRGPDDSGQFISKNGIAGLVSTRLAIQDLSSAGHQPMATADGRYTIVFNGEIYNFKELRSELEADGETFKSDSDTEVIVKMYTRYGADCVREFAGMFGIAIWDEIYESCFIARGALGIKPLYYFEGNGQLIFASEVRALLDSGWFPRKLCRGANVRAFRNAPLGLAALFDDSKSAASYFSRKVGPAKHRWVQHILRFETGARSWAKGCSFRFGRRRTVWRLSLLSNRAGHGS